MVHTLRLLAVAACLFVVSRGEALQSAVWFSPDGYFPEYADPSTRLVDSFPIEADYTSGDSHSGRSPASVGWTFELNEAASLEALGVYDYGADGLLVDHLVGLWKISNLGDLDRAEPIAMSLVRKGAETPFDGLWRYSESLHEHPAISNALSDYDYRVLDVLSVDPAVYWDYYRDRVQTLTPGAPLPDVVLEPGRYAILSNQIASASNRGAVNLEGAELIDLHWFVEPAERYPEHDSRLSLDTGYTVAIGPDAYDHDAVGQPHEFYPTNVQLFSSMMVGPTLFLGIPEPSSILLITLAVVSVQASVNRKPA